MHTCEYLARLRPNNTRYQYYRPRFRVHARGLTLCRIIQLLGLPALRGTGFRFPERKTQRTPQVRMKR